MNFKVVKLDKRYTKYGTYSHALKFDGYNISAFYIDKQICERTALEYNRDVYGMFSGDGKSFLVYMRTPAIMSMVLMVIDEL